MYQNNIAVPKPESDRKTQITRYFQKERNMISTGIHSFDRALHGGLSNDLYILGAETSTGKSAFMQALAEAAAGSGIHVLYFALEMSRQEFVARGTSSVWFQVHGYQTGKDSITVSDILYPKYDESTGVFIQTPYDLYEKEMDLWFERYGSCIHIIEPELNGISAKEIAETVTRFREKQRETGDFRPVMVFIDYLQILKADPSEKNQSDRKTKMDTAVTMLKTLAFKEQVPVIAASSVGRTNYGKTISTASYKESGDVEYTGGILLGWNWSGVTDAKNEAERSRVIVECKEKGYREMCLEILKYRNAEKDQKIRLFYYPAYNFFSEENVFGKGGKTGLVSDDLHISGFSQGQKEKSDSAEKTKENKKILNRKKGVKKQNGYLDPERENAEQVRRESGKE